MTKRAAKPIPTPGLDELLCFAIYTAGHAFGRVYKPVLDALGLTYPQYLVMVALWAKDDQNVGSLGDQLHLESNTLTPLLKRLEAAGYVARQRDPKDERQVRVRLTEKGAALRAKARDVPRCILEATGLPRAELARLRDDVAALTANLVAADPAARK
jgi:DNA-binding MarR family transcriptional regulator